MMTSIFPVVSELVAWLLQAMLAWVPLSAHDWYSTREETRAHYESIAEDIVRVTFRDDERPLFNGTSGRAKTALLLASVASFESTFNATVGRGGSIRPGDNDRGLAVGLWQTHVYGTTEEGWTRDDLANDREKQIVIALRRMRTSFTVCRFVDLSFRLSHYATGGPSCRPVPHSVARMKRALAWWASHPYAAPGGAPHEQP